MYSTSIISKLFSPDGVVTVTVENDKGEKIIVSKLGVGDFFGEMSLMTGEPRTANIVAEIPCVVLKVNKDTIKNIFSITY